MRQPNIVFVFADQMRAHVLGGYGNRMVPTPNFDAMCAGGMTFDNAISTFPVCSPYRAMLLSGRYPMANGVVNNDIGLRNDLPSIATACKASGYQTGYIGKWHLEWNRRPFVPKARRMGFDGWAVNNCTHQYLDHFYCRDTPRKIHFKGYDAMVQTDLAIAYIKKHQSDPFCLFLSWGPPHDPYNRVPQAYKKRIPLKQIKLRRNVREHKTVDHLMALDHPSERQAQRRAAKRQVLHDGERLKRECLQGYYAHTTALDDCMGKLRQALQDTGVAEDTILVFASDHGDMLGSHRMGSKQSPFEESIRVPCIVEYPRRVPKGRRTDALLAPVDLMPTLLGLAGVACPAVDGKDVSGVACGSGNDQQDAVLLMKMMHGGNPYNMNAITPWRGVRTKQYTYCELEGYGPWLLFDNLADPFQMDNLVRRRDCQALRQRLAARMRALMAEAGDPGNVKDVKAAVAARKNRLAADPA